MTINITKKSFTLKSYQQTTVDFCLKNKYAIVALEMGLGKSLVSLVVREKTQSKMLVVCPAYLIPKWAAEVQKFFPGTETKEFYKRAKISTPPRECKICFISYNSLPYAEVLFEWAGIVCFDEATFLKNMDAKRTKEAHKLVYENSIQRVLLLTGTPIQNRVYEFYSLLAITQYDPQIKESKFLKSFPDWITFANKFSYFFEQTVTVTTKNGAMFDKQIPKWTGLKNKEELKQILKGNFINFRSNQVLDLPESIRIDVPATIDNFPSNYFEAFEKFTVDESIASDVKRAAAVATAPFTIQYVSGLLEEVERVIIYTDHVPSCIELAKAFSVPPITGQMATKKRDEVAQKFKSGEYRVLVATYGAFSTGIDLQFCQDMVFNDLPFVPGVLSQAEFRVIRIGQTKTCRFHRILGSVQASKILNILEEKYKTINKLMN